MQENNTAPVNKLNIDKKKLILFAIVGVLALIVILIFMAAVVLKNRGRTINDVTFSNSRYSFVYYDNNQIKDLNNDGSVVILSKRNIDEDRMNTIRIEVYKQVGFALGEEFANFTIDNIEALDLDEYEVLILDEKTISDKKAYQIRYSYKENGKTVVNDTTYISNNSDIYEINMLALEGEAIDYEIIYSKVLSQFKVN